MPNDPAARFDGRIQVRVDGGLRDWLADRADRMNDPSLNRQARTELEMWHTVLETERRRIRLTLRQLQCITDICAGWLLDTAIAASAPLVYLSCEEEFRAAREAPWETSYADRYGIDEQQLLDYLRSLSPVGDHALRDALNRLQRHELPTTAEGFTKAGLRVIPDPAAERTE
jgi:hypothetical protein